MASVRSQQKQICFLEKSQQMVSLFRKELTFFRGTEEKTFFHERSFSRNDSIICILSGNGTYLIFCSVKNCKSNDDIAVTILCLLFTIYYLLFSVNYVACIRYLKQLEKISYFDAVFGPLFHFRNRFKEFIH